MKTHECVECGAPAVCCIHVRDRTVSMESDSAWAGHDVPVIDPYCDECATEDYPEAERLPLSEMAW